MLATKFVLVGDHYQLPPLVQVSTYLLITCFLIFMPSLLCFKFLHDYRVLKPEKMGWASAYFGGCQKHILRQFQHCVARSFLMLHLLLRS
jgi:hypothetical protein